MTRVVILGHCEPVLMGFVGSLPEITVKHKYANVNYMLNRLLKSLFLIIFHQFRVSEIYSFHIPNGLTDVFNKPLPMLPKVFPPSSDF